eukprot:TRINITY_DN82600_c0_g1_i1.p1 TRINITY_DN82600_c0_g1~~TRINITY_DN82600_c0_g1_i1.p1  ORF type:complete len:387 (-),score=21.80 TRINITY_DN82600_c0_g1_i1:231-1391(-)
MDYDRRRRLFLFPSTLISLTYTFYIFTDTDWKALRNTAITTHRGLEILSAAAVSVLAWFGISVSSLVLCGITACRTEHEETGRAYREVATWLCAIEAVGDGARASCALTWSEFLWRRLIKTGGSEVVLGYLLPHHSLQLICYFVMAWVSYIPTRILVHGSRSIDSSASKGSLTPAWLGTMDAALTCSYALLAMCLRMVASLHRKSSTASRVHSSVVLPGPTNMDSELMGVVPVAAQAGSNRPLPRQMGSWMEEDVATASTGLEQTSTGDDADTWSNGSFDFDSNFDTRSQSTDSCFEAERRLLAGEYNGVWRLFWSAGFSGPPPAAWAKQLEICGSEVTLGTGEVTRLKIQDGEVTLQGGRLSCTGDRLVRCGKSSPLSLCYYARV